jgi:hypothetical protein
MKHLPVLDANAVAIDVGSEKLHVSIAGEAPKIFGTFTGDLENLRDWFKEQGVRTVAMEATGVYWLYLYEVLEATGFEVVVVKGRHVQNVPVARPTWRIISGWPRCTRMACCTAVSCRRPTSVACRITSGCAPTTSSARRRRRRKCRRPWNG